MPDRNPTGRKNIQNIFEKKAKRENRVEGKRKAMKRG